MSTSNEDNQSCRRAKKSSLSPCFGATGLTPTAIERALVRLGLSVQSSDHDLLIHEHRTITPSHRTIRRRPTSEKPECSIQRGRSSHLCHL
jgi:hypothetical protein